MPPLRSVQEAGDGPLAGEYFPQYSSREQDYARRPLAISKSIDALTPPLQAPQNGLGGWDVQHEDRGFLHHHKNTNEDAAMGLSRTRRNAPIQHLPASNYQPNDGPCASWAPPAVPDSASSMPATAGSHSARPVESGLLSFSTDNIPNSAPFTTPGPSSSNYAPARSQGFWRPGIERPNMAPFPRLKPKTQQLTTLRHHAALSKSQPDDGPTVFEKAEPQWGRVLPQVQLPGGSSSHQALHALVPGREDSDDYQSVPRQAHVVASAWAPFRGPHEPKPLKNRSQASRRDKSSGDIGPTSFSSTAVHNHLQPLGFLESGMVSSEPVDTKALALPGLPAGLSRLASNPTSDEPAIDTFIRPGKIQNASADVDVPDRGPRGIGTTREMGGLVAVPQLECHRGALVNDSGVIPTSSSPANLTSSSPTAQVSLRRRLDASISKMGSSSETCSQHAPSSQRLEFPHAPPMVNGVPLINPREAIPDRFRAVFPYGVFNMVQSKCFAAVYESSENVVVSAPTGSGKTVLLELAICKLTSQKASDNAKVVYVAPTKALCKEKAEQWKRKFGVMAMPVSELTGDTSRAEMKNVREAKIIVTTPEKWDSLTRSWSDHRRLLDLVELFLIDEVHILRESRGATLEAVVSRMKTYGAKVRFLALSATIPNSNDIAAWLGKSHTSPQEPAHREVFGEECRPVRLAKVVYGFDCKMGDHPFDAFLNGQLWKHIAKHSQQKPLLIFCMTRKSCRDAAEQLAKEWCQRQTPARLWPEPAKRIPVIDAKLQELVRYGVAFHHAGLDSDDRKAIQQAFEEGSLSVICCTSTLAVGINLPCHTVVLKGTVGYQDGGQLCEYSDLEVMQMLGRAGRPQFGNSAVAIILTRSRNKKRYEDLGSGQQILESTLHKNLIEHLNSELSLGTFRNLVGATGWLKGTFLSVRLRRNPGYYGNLTDGTVSTSDLSTSVDSRLEKICKAAIGQLQDAYLIEGDPTFQPTEYGRAMSKYMIKFDTMKKILQLPRGAKTRDLLTTLCEAGEFAGFRWQNSERELFREFNKDPFIMYPVEGNVATVAHKVFLLIQMELGHVQMANATGFVRQHIHMETSRVLEVMHRLIRAVVECKGCDADGTACWAALELNRSMTARAWEGKSMQLLQVPQVGPVLMRKLVSGNFRTVAELADTDPGTIERIASRNPPFGKRMIDSLASFPRLTISAKIKRRTSDTDGKPLMHVNAVLGFSHVKGKWQGKMPIVTFIAMTSGGISAYFWRDSLKNFREDGNTYSIHFAWSPECAEEKIICRFACEEIVGTVAAVELVHNLPARLFTPRLQEPAKPLSEHQKASNHSAVDLDGEIDDDDILGLMNSTTGEGRVALGHGIVREDSYLMMDRDGNIEEMAQTPSESSQYGLPQAETGSMAVLDPIRLPNGRYKCGHPCSQAGGGKTARGHDCGHDCCRNGSKHPPRRGGKRKAHEKDPGSAEAVSEIVRPKSNPAAKRPKTGSQSKLQTQASPSCAAKTPYPSKLAIDLSAYGIDEEGLIDLTREDWLLDDDEEDFNGIMGSAKCNNAVLANNNTGESVSSIVRDTDSMLDGLADDDFKDLNINKQVGSGSKMPKNQSTSTGYSDEATDEGIDALTREKLDEDSELVIEAECRQPARARSRPQSRMIDSSPEDKTLPESILIEDTLFGDTAHNGRHNSSSRPQRSASQQHTDNPKLRVKELSEPAWVKEFDSDLIDEFRGLVDFI